MYNYDAGETTDQEYLDEIYYTGKVLLEMKNCILEPIGFLMYEI